MTVAEHASLLLSATEAKLRQHVAEAATEGDYATVVQLTAWARTVGELLSDTPVKQFSSSLQDGVRSLRARPQKSKRAEHGGLHQPYPRFFREGDRLVRVAWSKRDKKEYHHKTPSSVLHALIAKITEKASDGEIVSMDQLLPLNESDGSEAPSYQAYVGLALLKHAGLVDQHGRQGYSLPRPAEFKHAVEAVWRSLPKE